MAGSASWAADWYAYAEAVCQLQAQSYHSQVCTSPKSTADCLATEGATCTLSTPLDRTLLAPCSKVARQAAEAGTWDYGSRSNTYAGLTAAEESSSRAAAARSPVVAVVAEGVVCLADPAWEQSAEAAEADIPVQLFARQAADKGPAATPSQLLRPASLAFPGGNCPGVAPLAAAASYPAHRSAPAAWARQSIATDSIGWDMASLRPSEAAAGYWRFRN